MYRTRLSSAVDVLLPGILNSRGREVANFALDHSSADSAGCMSVSVTLCIGFAHGRMGAESAAENWQQ